MVILKVFSWVSSSKGKVITSQVELELAVIGLKSSMNGGISCYVHLYLHGRLQYTGVPHRNEQLQSEKSPQCVIISNILSK